MASNIPRKTHIFWNRIALIAGSYLAYYAYMKGLDDGMTLLVFIIGVMTVIVDYWFLNNV